MLFAFHHDLNSIIVLRDFGKKLCLKKHITDLCVGASQKLTALAHISSCIDPTKLETSMNSFISLKCLFFHLRECLIVGQLIQK